MEHKEWVGDLYDFGVEDQKIFIVGNSHYPSKEGESDRESLTVEVIREQLTKPAGFPFFDAIQQAFKSDKLFWHRVVFFNFQPEMVPSREEKYTRGTDEINERGKARVLRLLAKYKPDVVFVFSNDDGKGWRVMPETNEEVRKQDLIKLEGAGFPEHFNWGTYTVGTKTVKAFGLRHPLGAKLGLLPAAVATAMKLAGQ